MASRLTERTTHSYWDTVERYLSLLINGAANSIIAISSKRTANGDVAISENMAENLSVNSGNLLANQLWKG